MSPVAVQRPRVACTVEQLWQPAPGGSGTYVRELVRALVAGGEVDVTGIAARHGAPPPDEWSLPSSLPVRYARLPRTALYELWSRMRALPLDGVVPGASLTHATTWAVPATRGPLVVTVHDLAFLEAREHFTRRGNAFFRRALGIVRDEADRVVTVSADTASAVVAQGVEPERVVVVPHGVRVPDVTAADVARFRERHSLRRPYVLWCGTVEPRKNLPRLVAAFTRAAAAGLDADLVLVGPPGWGDAETSLADAVRDAPAGRVHRVGPVGWLDLHAAYRGARVLGFPSLREGFGMPVLEAMAHGVPVVTSAGTATAEVGGDAAVTADPRDVDALAAGLLDAAGPRHDELSQRGLARAAQYTWQAAAAATVDVYRHALKGR